MRSFSSFRNEMQNLCPNNFAVTRKIRNFAVAFGGTPLDAPPERASGAMKSLWRVNLV